MGDFLRDFDEENFQRLNRFLAAQAKSYRQRLNGGPKNELKPSLAPRWNLDSTSHVQHGVKMEGVAWNYKNEWCLDSQVIFDELGLCWDMELRPGNSKSGTGAAEQIRRVAATYKFGDEKYVSGDSAFCSQEPIEACLGVGAKFTLTANQATTGWENHIGEISKWEPWVFPEKEVKAAAEAGIELPQIQLGRFLWQPSWNERLRFPIVVKRTKVFAESTEGEWKYYGVVTNFNLFKNSLQSVIEFHNGRGNCENFIREEKYGYDLKHFPCLSLNANRGFGYLGLVAHNLLRWAALAVSPVRPQFAKGIRRRFVRIPAILVDHAKQIYLRVSENALKEVNRLREALELKPFSSPGSAGFLAG